MTQFSSVGLIGRPGSRNIDSNLLRLMDFLLARGHILVLESGLTYIIDEYRQLKNSNDDNDTGAIRVSSLEEMGALCDVAIVLGGDGTMLGAARGLCDSQTPIIGVNRGRVGFLTDIPANEMESMLGAMLDGHYEVDERVLLDTLLERDGVEISRAQALNDVVIHSGEVARLLEFDLYIDGSFVYRQRSDGLIVATPTGSTAYGLSAGGPILHPGLQAIALVPMCPHTLSSRTLVVSSDSEIELRICEHMGQQPVLACDGQFKQHTLAGDVIHITRKPKSLKLLHPEGHSFYESCRSKLGWNLSR